MRRGLRFEVCGLVALLAAGCSSGASKNVNEGQPASKVVGTSGGTVASTDGTVAVVLPPGALAGNVTITVAPAEPPSVGAIGTTYEIGPTGTQFAMPVTMKLSYDGVELHGASPSSLRVATFAAGGWQILPGAQVDTQAKTVSGLTTHLSPYAIVDASDGEVCATVRGPVSCSNDGTPIGGTDPGAGGMSTGAAGTTGGGGGTTGGSGATTGGGGGTTGGGAGTTGGGGGTTGGDGSGATTGGGGGMTGGGTAGTAALCDAPVTCAEATNICAAYPGATQKSCADGASDREGYTAACCFAPTAPICFAIETAYACAGSTNGAGGGGCPTSNVSCATADDPCRGYPGATFQGCTDTVNGYRGSCCFANDAPICVGVGAGCQGSGCTPPRCATANPCGQIAGSTVGSCTDTADGFQASCCFAARTLPPPVGSSSPSGAVDGGTTNPGADAGMTGGGSGGTGGPIDPGGSHDAGQPPPADGGDIKPPPDQDGGQPPPPPPADGGDIKPPPDQDGGQPPPPPPADGGDIKPPPDQDAGQPTPPPPTDGGAAGSCQIKPMPSDGTQPCSVSEVCPASGADYTVRCNPGDTTCTCMMRGQPTGSVAGSCTSFDAVALLSGCGFPADQGGSQPPPPPPPPPMDGGAAGSCQVKPMPSDGTQPCGVSEFCSATGTDYSVRCNPGDTTCTCMMMGQSTGAVAGSCTSFDAVALLSGCGFPTP
jgi:hypothetical protein